MSGKAPAAATAPGTTFADVSVDDLLHAEADTTRSPSSTGRNMAVILPRDRAPCRGKTRGVKCLVVLALFAACGAGTHRGTAASNKPGIIAGLIRDTKTGEVIALAEISVAGRTAKSNKYGMYEFENLKPGTYSLTARFADVAVTVNNILVSPHQAT